MADRPAAPPDPYVAGPPGPSPGRCSLAVGAPGRGLLVAVDRRPAPRPPRRPPRPRRPTHRRATACRRSATSSSSCWRTRITPTPSATRRPIPTWPPMLPASGAQLSEYHAIGHFSNDNYIALDLRPGAQSGQPVRLPGVRRLPGAAPPSPADGQIDGSGCVFPASVPTVADQLDAAHLTWKAYMQDMGNVPSRESAVCGHPAVGARRPHPDGGPRRRLRHPARPVRLLPLDHRRHRAVRRPRRPPRLADRCPARLGTSPAPPASPPTWRRSPPPRT